MIRLDRVTKVFGPSPHRALAAARQRAGKPRIRRTLGATLALDAVSLAIDDGGIFVVMGLSGSGKSTLVRLVNGLIAPDLGTVQVDGQNVAALSRADLTRFRRNRIAMVFQSFALFPHMSVADNVTFGLRVEGIPREDRAKTADRWLARVGLDGYASARPDELSGGMRQRVGLARALAVEAPVMLMDEPFSALDPVTRTELQDLLLDLQAELARTIVFVTHDLSEAIRLGTKIAVLDEGRLAQVAKPDDLVSNPATPLVARFVAAARQSPATSPATSPAPGNV